LSSAPSNPKEDLRNNLIQLLVYNVESFKEEQNTFSKIVIPSQKLGYARALLGLTFNSKLFSSVAKNPKEFVFMTASDESLDYALVISSEKSNAIFLEDRPDNFELVTEDQIATWNKIITDEFKADAFFGQYFGAQGLSNSSSAPLSLMARKGKTGLNTALLNINESSGNLTQWDLPVYMELKGSLDDKSLTQKLQGTFAYQYHNATLGVIQTYTNSPSLSRGVNNIHLETAIAASYALNKLFIEAQLGSVIVNEGSKQDLLGIRSQMTAGYDFNYVSPFVQYVHRNTTKSADDSVYLGLNIGLIELKTNSYSFTSALLFRTGQNSVKGLVGTLELNTSLDLNSGISFITGINLDEDSEKIKVQLSLTQ
jgi:hypothetical protein